MLTTIRSFSLTSLRVILDSKIRRNFLYLAAGDLGGRVLQFLSVIYLARVLTDTRYGLVAYALTIQAYLLMTVDFGLPTIGTRQLAQHKDGEGPETLVARIVNIRGIIALSCFFLATSFVLIRSESAEVQWVMIGTFAYVFCQFLNFDWVFQGFERMLYVGAARFVTQFLALVIMIVLVHSPQDVTLVPLIRASTGILVSLSLIALAFRLRLLSPQRYPGLISALRGWKNPISEAWPLAGASFLGLVMSTFDMFVLGMIYGTQAVGWYSIATSIFFFTLAVAGAMYQAFFPRLSAAYAQQGFTEFSRVYRRYWQSMLALGLVCTAAIALLGPILIGWFFGPAYLAGAPALQILMVAAFISFINHTFGGALVATGQQRISLFATIVGASISILGTLLLVPMLSLIGAAVSHVVAEGASSLVEAFFVQRFFKNQQKGANYV